MENFSDLYSDYLISSTSSTAAVDTDEQFLSFLNSSSPAADVVLPAPVVLHKNDRRHDPHGNAHY